MVLEMFQLKWPWLVLWHSKSPHWWYVFVLWSIWLSWAICFPKYPSLCCSELELATREACVEFGRQGWGRSHYTLKDFSQLHMVKRDAEVPQGSGLALLSSIPWSVLTPDFWLTSKGWGPVSRCVWTHRGRVTQSSWLPRPFSKASLHNGIYLAS